ncbi:hypothetical protein [Sphingomonas rubra]|uniref:Terminase small subunit n=1 Tax=Sphingomonas rubra TaxID=634430 RepID=A0A1I5TIN2_9SPHN|nr:hypothetical protein [Sphingomonas rubra]SFP82922.1 hypothetical protein SAMN04488241_10868 [Sphingomonas rubra]
MGDEVKAGPNRAAYVRRQGPNALTAAKRQRFLDVMAATANVRRAAEEAGASPASFYKLRRRDLGFAAAWDQSLDDSFTMLKGKLLESALGTAEQEPGDPDRAGITDRFDPTLGLQLMKLHEACNKVPSNYGRASGCKQVPIEDVERSLLRKLAALRRRLEQAGVDTPELPS